MHIRLFHTAAVYLASNALNKLIPIVIVFLLSHKLPLSDYGKVSLFLTYAALYLPLLSFNSFMSLDRSIPLAGVSNEKVSTEIGASCNLIVLTHITLFVIFLVATILDVTGTYIPMVATIYSLPFSMVFLSLQIYKNTESPLKYAFNSIVCNFLCLFLIVLLFCGEWFFKISLLSLNYVLVAYMAAAGVAALCSLLTNPYLRRTPILFSYRDAFAFAVVSIPFLIHALSAVIINFSDRLIINYFLGSESLGVYSVAYMLGMSVSLLQDSFHKMYAPYIMRQYKSVSKGNFGRNVEIKNMIMGGGALIILSVAVTYAVSIIANLLLAQNYHVQPLMVMVIGLAYAANGVLRFFIPRLMYVSKMGTSATVLMGSAVFGALLNIIMVPAFGIWGAAITTLVSFTLSSVVIFVFWYKYYDENAY